MNTPVSKCVNILAGKEIVCMGFYFNKKLPLLSFHFNGGEKDKTRCNGIKPASLIKLVFQNQANQCQISPPCIVR